MIFAALTTILAPISILVIPGIALLPRWYQKKPILLWALIILVSLTSTELASLAGAWLGLPQIYVFALLLAITAIGLAAQYRTLLRITTWYSIVSPLVLFMTLLLLFSLPFLFVHDGLPTGDIQKSIVWAQDILQTNTLPNYQRAIIDYNRDPVDFYTLGLHTLLAYVLEMNPSPTTAGFFGLTIALAVAGIGAALAQQLFPHLPAFPLLFTYLFLLLTNVRFLRYLREPGYHIQNSVGELFLFGIILVCIILVRRWQWDAALLVSCSLLALATVHQFSMFIAAFALVPFGITLAWSYFRSRKSIVALTPILVATISIIGLGFFLDLDKKIPHIFSAAPHLTSSIPAAFEYFTLLGPVWFCLGLAGLTLLLLKVFRRRSIDRASVAYVISMIIFLALSQAPRLYIDIPPVRALFYSVIPLSITGAFLLSQFTGAWSAFSSTRIVTSALIIIMTFASFSSLTTAYTLSHTIRTNSSLLPEHIPLIEYIRQNDSSAGVLIDDYNRRSASWLILSHRPMYTRIAADIAQQMAESRQSKLRSQLYLNQLDFEKIFSLGSFPAITSLMTKHNITYVTGITGSSADAFSHNPALQQGISGGDVQLFMPASLVSRETSTTISWLLRSSTLVNDIGDNEDTFEHLPASLRAVNISNPLYAANKTYRTTAAAVIPLQFNVDDYVNALWDQDQNKQIDRTVEFLIIFAATPTTPLTLKTPSGTSYPIRTDETRTQIPATELLIDEKGFITLSIENPTGELVSLDLIALGLAQIP